MKKGLLSLLAVALTIVSCQNYDDQFAELTGLVNDLSTDVAGLSQVQTDLGTLSTLVSNMKTAIDADFTSIEGDIATLEQLLTDVADSQDLGEIVELLADLQEDVDTLLEADAVINQPVTITNSANLEYVSSLIGYAVDDPNVIVNGAVTINTTALNASETITANAIAGKIRTVIGNVTITSAAALNLESLSFINGDYSVSGSDANDVNLATISGSLTTNYPGVNDYTHLSEVGAVVISNSASATLVDFTGVTVASFDDGTASPGVVVFDSATSVNLGTAPVTSVQANAATSVETRMVTAAGITISATSATAINVNQMTSSTGNISVTGAGTTTIVHFDGLATSTGDVTTVAVGEAHFGALTQAGTLAIAANAAANFGALTDTDAAASIGGQTVILTALAAATGTLTLPNATTANLPAFSTSTLNGVSAAVATSANMVSAAVADLSLPSATTLTLTSQAEDFVTTDATRIAQIPAVTSLDITGKAISDGTAAGVTGTDIDITSSASITTISVAGDIHSLSVDGGDVTSITTAGNISDLLIENAGELTSLTLGHTFITGDTAVTISVQNSDKLAALDMSNVSKVKSIDIQGNAVLASIVAPSATVLPEAGAAISATTGTNSLTGAYTFGVDETAATETTALIPAIAPIIASNSLNSILTWWNAAAANADAGVATSTSLEVENLTWTDETDTAQAGDLTAALGDDTSDVTAFADPIANNATRALVTNE